MRFWLSLSVFVAAVAFLAWSAVEPALRPAANVVAAVMLTIAAIQVLLPRVRRRSR